MRTKRNDDDSNNDDDVVREQTKIRFCRPRHMTNTRSPIERAHGQFAAKLFDLSQSVNRDVVVLAIELGRAKIDDAKEETARRCRHVALTVDVCR